MPKKAIVFVDANNWYHNLKKYLEPGDVDIMKVSEFLCSAEETKNLIYKTPFNIKIYFKEVKMEIAITKMSQNGQVVIPSEIRNDANIKPSTKFIVFNEGGNILLKQLRKETLAKDMELIEKIHKSEVQIRNKKFTKANTSMNDEEIDDLLMK